MREFRNYWEVLRVVKETIKTDGISNDNIKTLACFLCKYILDDEHPQTAAGNVVNTFVDCLNTEEIRISCDHNAPQSNVMTERYVLLLNTIGQQLKFSFPVSSTTKEFIESHSIFEPQLEAPETPEQLNEGNGEELAGNGNETQSDEAPGGAEGNDGEPRQEAHSKINAPSWGNLTDDEKWFFCCKADYDKFINFCAENKPDPKGVAEYYVTNIHNVKFDYKRTRKQLHKLLKKWGIVKVVYEHFNKVLNQEFNS
jgi:hypothetical protein